MKRKRGSGDDCDQVEPQTEHLSHIHIPIAVNEVPMAPAISQSYRETPKAIEQMPSEDRTDRMDWQHARGKGQPLLARDAVATPISPPKPSLNALRSSSMATRPSTTTLCDTIEAQFGLEILLKHRELRLIDQEIAKCQAALEQLRRCHVIPYPAMTSNPHDMEAVSNGTGRTLENDAPNAPSWGITSGPYTRHYQNWLLPGVTFGDYTTEQPVSQPTIASERSVRASTAGKSSLANQSRAQRGAGSARLKALPHGYPELKDDKGPMIVKRSTDGQMVKLVCLDCGRSDFNSAQGFINHCRIAHSRNFQSHDAAALACGEEVELDQAGGAVGESSTAVNYGAGLVHPLIRSAHTARSAAPTAPMTFPKREALHTFIQTPSRHSFCAAPDRRPPDRSIASALPTTPSSISALKPSSYTPHLSALFARIGRGGNLEEEVNLAKIKVDIDAAMLSDEDGDDEREDATIGSQPLSGPASYSTRGPVRPDHRPSSAVTSHAQLERSPSAKPPKVGSARPRKVTNPASGANEPSTVHLRGAGRFPDSQQPLDHKTPTPANTGLPSLSPTTVEAHQAPSLISDDDEYENTHSECSSAAEVAEDLGAHYFGVSFENQDDHTIEDLEGPGNNSGAKRLGLGTELKDPPQPTSAMRPPDAVRDSTVNNERHVSFASPLRRPRKKGSK
ncbi:MAG: hypothetical protein Q9170_001069 [Blastenia crenularia]